MNIKNKKYTDADLAEAMVFATDKEQHAHALDDFKIVRARLSSRQSEKSKQKTKLLQLKFMMEDYLASREFNKEYYFGYFLKEYIVRLEVKNKEFANDIMVNPAELSQVIKRRRKPTEKLIYRLHIHSNKNFPATIWFALLEKDRNFELYYNRTIIDSEEKHVKRKLAFSL